MSDADRRHPLEARIPPVLVWAVAYAGQWGVRRMGWVPAIEVPLAVRSAGAVIVWAAVALGIAAVVQFVTSRTTVDPHRVDRASALVTGGVYRITRNPMYLALLLVLVGRSVRDVDPLGLVFAVGFVLYMNRFQIGPEERALSRAFGREYDAFRRRTRRWI